MNRIILSMALSAIVFLNFSCYKEDPIVPSEAASAERYTFPQGTEEQDVLAKQVYDKFGVKIIYKNFKNLDFNLTWTAVGNKTGYDIPANQQKEAVSYIAENIFGNLSPKVTRRVLPPYFYVADSLSQVTLLATLESKSVSLMNYRYDGLDFWSFTWNGAIPYTKNLTTGVITYSAASPTPPRTSFAKFYRRGVMLKEILKSAILKGDVEMPPGFNDGMDFTTPIKVLAAEVNDANYYQNRGFPGRFSNQWNFNISATTYSANSGIGSNPQQNFIDYVQMAMRWTPDSVALVYPPARCPIIHAKYPVVVKWMKDKYDIDLVKIATKP